MNLANEGLEARKKEEEVTAKKRKAEEDAKWEGARRLRLISLSVEFLLVLMKLLSQQRIVTNA